MPEPGIEFEWAVDEAHLAALQAKLAAKNTRVGRMVATSANPVEKFVAWYGAQVAKEIKQVAPKFKGRLRSSIKFTWGRPTGGQVTMMKRGIYVDQGTRPFWPPIRPLKAWAASKGLNPWAVQAAIAQRGIRPQDFVEKGRKAAEKQLSPGLLKLGPQIEQLWGD